MWCVQDRAAPVYPPLRPLADIIRETFPDLILTRPDLVRRFDDDLLIKWMKMRKAQSDQHPMWKTMKEIADREGREAMMDRMNIEYIAWLEENHNVPIGELVPRAIPRSWTVPVPSAAAQAEQEGKEKASTSGSKGQKRQRTKSASSSASKAGRLGSGARSGKAPRAEQEELSDDDASQTSSQSSRHERDSDFNP